MKKHFKFTYTFKNPNRHGIYVDDDCPKITIDNWTYDIKTATENAYWLWTTFELPDEWLVNISIKVMK